MVKGANQRQGGVFIQDAIQESNEMNVRQKKFLLGVALLVSGAFAANYFILEPMRTAQAREFMKEILVLKDGTQISEIQFAEGGFSSRPQTFLYVKCDRPAHVKDSFSTCAAQQTRAGFAAAGNI